MVAFLCEPDQLEGLQGLSIHRSGLVLGFEWLYNASGNCFGRRHVENSVENQKENGEPRHALDPSMKLKLHIGKCWFGASDGDRSS
jgi:hypothetical protein